MFEIIFFLGFIFVLFLKNFKDLPSTLSKYFYHINPDHLVLLGYLQGPTIMRLIIL